MKIKFLIGIFATLIGVFAAYMALSSVHAVVLKPKGIVAQKILVLIITNILLMLSIIVPACILLIFVVWKYCIKKVGQYDPDHKFGVFGEVLMWVLPSIVVAVMAVITWKATHDLNPYKPLEGNVKPLTVQVIAIDWKWLFIYPEQGIATLNYFPIPEKTPIHLRLTADHAPMSSFWIPNLSGQIYSMTGMITQLHLMADEPGEYTGRAVEINGLGYSGMTFLAKSTSQEDFEKWVADARKSPLQLTQDVYDELIKPTVINTITLYSEVEEGLFENIVDKYMFPAKRVL